MPKTIGQEADDAAFEKMMLTTFRFKGAPLVALLRFAFDEGMGRGLEKRGCCEDKDADDGGR